MNVGLSIQLIAQVWANTIKTTSLFLPVLITIQNMLGRFLLKINQEKVQLLHPRLS